jgi:uracil-DNA glycosylase
MPPAVSRRDELKEVFAEARGCPRCPQLVATRTQVVFGAGDADADLMLVGEAPGAREDEQGLPLVGAAGRLLDDLLAGIGLSRDDVFVTTILKCRPPGNRDPAPVEVENCRSYLLRQVELVQPKVVCTLGGFATKLLRGEPEGITLLHGRPEVRAIGARTVRLYPIHHPAAALYTRALEETLREDVARIPGLLALPVPEPGPEPDAEPAELRPGPEDEVPGPAQEQLGLF